MLKFIAFLLISHFGVLQIFRLTTYHAYFWKALPLLVGYSALVGWAINALEMHIFFLWQVVLESAWLFYVSRKQSKAASVLLNSAGGTAAEVRTTASSVTKTASYFAYSAFVYVITFSLIYLWLYNS